MAGEEVESRAMPLPEHVAPRSGLLRFGAVVGDFIHLEGLILLAILDRICVVALLPDLDTIPATPAALV
jgi:hypothetical protein